MDAGLFFEWQLDRSTVSGEKQASRTRKAPNMSSDPIKTHKSLSYQTGSIKNLGYYPGRCAKPFLIRDRWGFKTSADLRTASLPPFFMIDVAPIVFDKPSIYGSRVCVSAGGVFVWSCHLRICFWEWVIIDASVPTGLTLFRSICVTNGAGSIDGWDSGLLDGWRLSRGL